MIKTKNHKILGFFGALIAIFALLVLLYRPLIFQEGNPVPLMEGIVRLNFTQDKIVKLDKDGNRYLTKSQNGQEIIKSFMQEKAYSFTEQMGSGYFFQNNDVNRMIAVRRQYSRFYAIWRLTEVGQLSDPEQWIESRNKEPLSYLAPRIDVVKEYRPFSYTADHLREMSDECGIRPEDGYFDKLVAKFSNSPEIVYSFKYQDETQNSRLFVVTLLPNKAEYLSFADFKKDFDLCAAGGDLYPAQLNKDWLLFVNSCGSGALSNGSCDNVRKTVEPSLKLN